MKKLRRAIIKEEFAVLTGNIKSALILDNLVETFIKNNFQAFSKKNSDFLKETLNIMSKTTLKNIMEYIENSGWVTTFYFNGKPKLFYVNIKNLQNDLLECGYELQGIHE